VLFSDKCLKKQYHAREAERRDHPCSSNVPALEARSRTKTIEFHGWINRCAKSNVAEPPSHTECSTNARERGSAHEIASKRDRVIECLKRSPS
jgi:hypothetical protein